MLALILIACNSGTAQLEPQDLSALEERLEELEETVDDQAAQLAVLTATLVSDKDALSAELVALDLRVAELEAASGSGGSGGGGGEDYSDEIMALQAAVDALEVDLMSSRPVAGSIRERLPIAGSGTGSSWEPIHSDALTLDIVDTGPILVWCHLRSGSTKGGFVRLALVAEDGTEVTSDYWGRSTTDDVSLGEEFTALAALTPSATGAVSVQCQGQNTGFEELDLMAVQLPE